MKRTTTLEPRPYLMANKIQPYAWGSRGKDAFIPRFLGIEPLIGPAYAELWMGVHPKAPSDVVLSDGSLASLSQLIDQHPVEILGQEVCDRFSGTLPFLFKVLSAAQALSIQVHPNAEQAQILHAQHPEHYPDANHKPEIAIALDSLTALAGFKTIPAILQTLQDYPELAHPIGQDICRELQSAPDLSPSQQRELVGQMYSTLVGRSLFYKDELVAAIARLENRLARTSTSLKEEEQLFLDLRKRYTGADVGLFSIFLLNLVHLERGQAMFIPDGVPHAYLKGNIIECMANSDNVVRVGLTPKFKDAETLVKILTYEPGPLPIIQNDPDSNQVTYHTPAAEFQVSRWKVELGAGIATPTQDRPRILLVTEGQVIVDGKPFKRGQSILIPACLDEFYLVSGEGAEVFVVEVPLA